MKRGFAAAIGGAALVIAGLSGCSSNDSSDAGASETSAAATSAEETTAADTVLGFDPSSGTSGELATVDEVSEAVRTGEVAEAVDVASFDAWREATGTRALDMGACVPPALYEFLGGDPAERDVEPTDLVTYVATAAAIRGRIQSLGVEPGDEIPDAVFDEEYSK